MLLVYQVRIWERWRRDHDDAQRLPTIVPLVLYHGEQPWSVPQSLEHLVDIRLDSERRCAAEWI